MDFTTRYFQDYREKMCIFLIISANRSMNAHIPNDNRRSIDVLSASYHTQCSPNSHMSYVKERAQTYNCRTTEKKTTELWSKLANLPPPAPSAVWTTSWRRPGSFRWQCRSISTRERPSWLLFGSTWISLESLGHKRKDCDCLFRWHLPPCALPVSAVWPQLAWRHFCQGANSWRKRFADFICKTANPNDEISTVLLKSLRGGRC